MGSGHDQHFGIGGFTGLAWKVTSRMHLNWHLDVDTPDDSAPTPPCGGHNLVTTSGATAIEKRKLSSTRA